MQTLLSTRLFSPRSLDEAALRLPRDEGFLSLELLAKEGHFNPFSPGEPTRIKELLAANGMTAPWLRFDEGLFGELNQPARVSALTSLLVELGVQVVTVPFVPQGGPSLRDLHQRAEQAGAKLGVDFVANEPGRLTAIPEDIGLCWDLATPPASDEEDRTRVTSVAGRMPRRLQGVRLAHLERTHRGYPTEREAGLLEEIWPHVVPQTMVYDVEDPSGGSLAELQRIFSELHAFHAGERRPPGGKSGGVFWSALAPG